MVAAQLEKSEPARTRFDVFAPQAAESLRVLRDTDGELRRYVEDIERRERSVRRLADQIRNAVVDSG